MSQRLSKLCIILAPLIVAAGVCCAQIQRNQVRPDAYGAPWNGDRYRAGSADAVYDKIESLLLGIAGAYIDLASYTPAGDGVTNDGLKIQAALDDAVAAGKGLIIRRPGGPGSGYRVDAPLIIHAADDANGLHVLGLGFPRLIYGGTGPGSMLQLAAVSDSRIEGLWFDCNDVVDVNGISITTAIGVEADDSTQRLSLRDCRISDTNEAAGLVFETADPAKTVNHFDLYQCVLANCQEGILNLRGVRHLSLYDTKIEDCNTYAVHLAGGELTMFGGLFSNNTTSDIYIDANSVCVQLYGTKTLSDHLLTSSAAAHTHFNGYASNILSGVAQAVYPAPGGTVIDYDVNQPLIMHGCTLGGSVAIGSNVPEVHATACLFDSGDFTGTTTVLREEVIGYKSFSLTIDDPNSLVDPNVMMLPVAIAAYPHGLVVTNLAMQTRGATTYTLEFYDYNSPVDASPTLLGSCATSASTADANDIADTTVAVGHTIVIRVPAGTDLNQLQAIVYGKPKAR